MATYDVTDQTSARRVQFTGNGTAGPFAFAFQVNATSEVKVFVDTTEKTETTHYTVTLNSSTGAGTISFTTGNHPTSSQTITILGDIPLSRTSVYTSGGQFTASSLESDFDTNMFIHQQTNEEINRSLRQAEHDVISGADMTLPVKDTRKGTVLGFNATTGNPEAGPNITAVQSLADVTTAINLLGTSDVVTDMGLLATSANVTAMGLLGTSSNVTAIGLLGTSDVVADMALLGTSDVVADMALLADTDVIADMNTLATSDIISDLNTLATSDIVTDMNLLATSDNVTAMGILGTSANVTAMGLLGTSAVVTDMGLLATSTVIEDMGILATSANVTAMGLLGTSSNVTAMGLLGTSAVVTDMGLLATSAVIEDMGLLATSANVTNMATLGASGVVANIATVASNVSGVNSFAERYRVQAGVPGSDNDIGDLVFDTTANTLKVFGSSGYQNAGSSVNGTSERFTYNITGTPTTLTGASGTGFAEANGNTLAYDAGFIDVYLNGVKMVNGTDVTVTSGTSVVFASALSNGDVVDIVTFGTFSVANIVSTGALNSGSITSGFGNIDNGSSTITTTGAITGGTLTGTLQTASQTNITSVGTLSGLAVSGATTITTADNTAQLTLKSTDADANSAPLLDMKRDSSSPSADDFLGQINFIGENNASEETTYSQITGRIEDVTDGAEDGRLTLKTMRAGSSRSAIDCRIDSITINDDGDDVDFRVEAVGFNNALLIRGSDGNVFVGKSSTSASVQGLQLRTTTANGNAITANSSTVLRINRQSDDGDLLHFLQANNKEGGVSVSGSTVFYNTFTGSHWSRLSDNSKPTILKGTVIETIDEMCDWYQAEFTMEEATEDTPEVKEKISIALPKGKSVGDKISITHEGVTYDDATILKEKDNKHPKCKISDTADSKKVYGVYSAWDNDDDAVNDMFVTAVGTYVVRINKDVTVQAGDLLSSNGDGTAKVQDDDIIRSKTIGKVLTKIKQETYDDGSYTVPCALYCG